MRLSKPIKISFQINFVLKKNGSRTAVKRPTLEIQTNAIDTFANLMLP